jgi:hypothetical protein
VTGCPGVTHTRTTIRTSAYSADEGRSLLRKPPQLVEPKHERGIQHERGIKHERGGERPGIPKETKY